MYSLATKSSEKTNRRNYFTVSNMTKWHRNAGSILRRQWHSMRTQSTSGVYNRCKQTESIVRSTYLATATLLFSLLTPLRHKCIRQHDERLLCYNVFILFEDSSIAYLDVTHQRLIYSVAW